MKKKRLFIILFIIFIGITLVDVEAIGTMKLDNAPYLNTGRKVACGNDLVKGLPEGIVTVSSTLYNAVMIIVPVIIIIFGVVDLVKAILAQKEDDIKKGRENLIKRIITAVIVFLVVMIVKFATGVFAKDNGANIIDCIDCFISADCDNSTVSSNKNSTKKSNVTSTSNSSNSSTSNSSNSNTSNSSNSNTSNQSNKSNYNTGQHSERGGHGGGSHRR